MKEERGPLEQAESEYLDSFKKINDSVNAPQPEPTPPQGQDEKNASQGD